MNDCICRDAIYRVSIRQYNKTIFLLKNENESANRDKLSPVEGREMLFQNKYLVESTRFKEWDYSFEGHYYITICLKNREHHFGNIKDGAMILSNIGKIADIFWKEIPLYFPFVRLDEFVMMPNHLHGIVILDGGAEKKDTKERGMINRDAINRVSTDHGGITKNNNPMLNQAGISYIVRWYKGRVAYEIRKKSPQLKNSGFAWQSRFYDHVIRSEKDFIRIREYIRSNPQNWDADEENKPMGI